MNSKNRKIKPGYDLTIAKIKFNAQDLSIEELKDVIKNFPPYLEPMTGKSTSYHYYSIEKNWYIKEYNKRLGKD